ncbi:MAG: protein TolQ [Deltaproteobacteria bacterium]|nr:protein TolQ [Deltaproteobacteria bacterium]
MVTAIASEGPAREVALSLGAFDIIYNASPMVMIVLLVLLVLSVLTWAIIFYKWGVMRHSWSDTENFLDVFWSGKSLDFIYTESKKFGNGAVAKVFQAGYIELQRLMEKDKQRNPASTDSAKALSVEYSIGNLERALSKANRTETLKLERSLAFLATAGSTAPFIGLFGTVWGIMNSFQNIGAQGGASLATVAPGIAEALVATAVGLFCAIPAVMGYNYFIQRVRGLRTKMDNFSGDFLNIVKRNFLTV